MGIPGSDWGNTTAVINSDNPLYTLFVNVRVIVAAGFVAILLPAVSFAATCPTLSLGSTGASVTALQTFLHKAYTDFPSPTGRFGPLTQAAVKQWQKEHGLPVLGIVGPNTRAAMKLGCATGVSSVVTKPSTQSSTASLIQTLLAQVKILQEKLAALLAASSGTTNTAGTVATTGAGDTGGGSGGGGNTGGGGGNGGGGTTTPSPASCTFNGQTVASGASVTAYQSATVPYGSQCASQARTCNDGTLSGSYTNASCSVQQSADPLSGYWPITSGSQVDSLFSSISWAPSAYNRVFTTMAYPPYTSTIPLPNNSTGTAVVAGDYSQAVVYSQQQHKYYMFFGASVLCTNQAAYRDSIALAESTDGMHFTFSRYLLEPQNVCTTPSSSWAVGKVFQYNDPSALLTTVGGQEYVYTAYTVAVWDPNVNPQGYGNIGMAAFSVDASGPTLTYQNDNYLTPDFTHCPGVGFARPSLEWAPEGTMLWFDNNQSSRICKIPVTNVQQLSAVTVVDAGTAGGNVEIYRLGNYDVLLADGGTGQGIQYQYAPAGTTQWSALKQLSPISGQGWDSGNHGGGELLVNPDTCQAHFYFAGVKTASAPGRLYDSIDIASTDTNSSLLGKVLCKARYGI